MCQKDILDFLKAHKKRWFSCRELCAELGTAKGCTSKQLKQLRKFNLVDYEGAKFKAVILYSHKT